MDSILAAVLVVAVTLVASLAVSGFIFGVIGRGQDYAQIAVTGTALPAADFTRGGTTTTFTCAPTSSLAYLALTNTGTGSATVATISITWAGSSTEFTLSGACDIGASYSPTANQFIIFPATTETTSDAVAGQTYTGTITLSSGAQVLFTGTWQ